MTIHFDDTGYKTTVSLIQGYDCSVGICRSCNDGAARSCKRQRRALDSRSRSVPLGSCGRLVMMMRGREIKGDGVNIRGVSVPVIKGPN